MLCKITDCSPSSKATFDYSYYLSGMKNLTNLQDVDLSVVHVLEELLEVLRPDVLEEDDGVLVALAPRQHLPEEGRAHAQHDLVRLEHAPPARQRHVRQDLQKRGALVSVLGPCPNSH